MSEELHPSELGMSESETGGQETIQPVRQTRTPQQRVADLQQQLSRAQAEVRKLDTRRKIVLGGACLSLMNRQPTNLFDVNVFRAVLWDSLSEKDRELVHDLFYEPSVGR